MKTPITDLASYDDPTPGIEVVSASIARRLEADRAALMEALEGISKLLDDDTWNRPTQKAWKKCRSALAAAKANFPSETPCPEN